MMMMFLFKPIKLAYKVYLYKELIYPEFKSDVNYNEEFWKTYLKN